MGYAESSRQQSALRGRITELRKEMRAIQQAIEPESVQDYVFRGAGGASVRLSELFGASGTLVVIHNMGAGCVYCTMWADGFNGGAAGWQPKYSYA